MLHFKKCKTIWIKFIRQSIFSYTTITILTHLFIFQSLNAQISSTSNISETTYNITDISDYTFNEILSLGITSTHQKMQSWNIPVRELQFFIRGYIRMHDFELCGACFNRNKVFRIVKFTYPSIAPNRKPIELSGLAVFPLTDGTALARMMIYNDFQACGDDFVATQRIPILSLLAADNTLCVFPDYYGRGSTSGYLHPFLNLKYHALCATECALVALNIATDMGIILDNNFYTWNAGYSRGGGIALAVHQYIETQLPNKLRKKINLKWSLCGDGIYRPATLFKHSINNNNLGVYPAIYLLSMNSLFSYPSNYLNNISTKTLLSDTALSANIDSLLEKEDGLWPFMKELDKKITGYKPSIYFNHNVLDTTSEIFQRVSATLSIDDLTKEWHPTHNIVFYHSLKDKCIPISETIATKEIIDDGNGICFIHSPQINGNHGFTGFQYFAMLLGCSEPKLYKKFFEK